MNVRLASAVIGATMLSMTASTFAAGIVNVQRSDGSSSSYLGAKIEIVGKTLRVHSGDGKGTLVIERAACSYQGPILMCLPTSVVLRQNGMSRTIALASGTVYYNPTAAPETLPFSSRHILAHGILLGLHTARGTSISVDGVVDKGAAR